MIRKLSGRWRRFFRWAESHRRRLVRVHPWRVPLWTFLIAFAVAVLAFWVGDRTGAALIAIAGIFAVGVALAATAPRDSHWNDLGRALIPAAILSAAFGYYSFRQKVADDQHAFEARVSLQRDLGHADLDGEDMSGFQLAKKNLAGADLSDADLSEANLRGARLAGVDLSGADLRNADLRDANLKGATLGPDDEDHDVNLTGAKLLHANLQGATLESATLRDASLVSTHLADACLAQAQLEGAELTGSNLHGATLTGAHVEDAVFGKDYRPAKLNARRRTDGGYLEPAGLANVHQSSTTWPRGFDLDEARRTRPISDLPPWHAHGGVRLRVVGLADGDTLFVENRAGTRFPVQLLGVDAGPRGTSLGDRAIRYLNNHLRGNWVTAVSPKVDRFDDFHRRWVTFQHGDRSVNELLVAYGIETLLDEGPMPPDQLQLLKAEALAKRSGESVWSSCPAASSSG